MKGKILNLSPEDIIVKDRFRKEFKPAEIKALAESIREHGQLQPIGVIPDKETGKYLLVYGHRRLLAIEMIRKAEEEQEIAPRRRTKVKALVLPAEDYSELNLKIMEFIENSLRLDFTPVEKAEAVSQLHEELKAENENWSVEKTAELLGLTRQYIHELLKIAKSVQENIIPRERAEKMTISELRKTLTTVGKVNMIKEAVVRAQIEAQGKDLSSVYRIDCADAFEYPFPENYFQICITDPPYGLNYQEQSDTLERETDFKDDTLSFVNPNFIKDFWELLDIILDEERGIALVSCSLEQFLLHKEFAPEFNFQPYRIPIVWIKSASGIPYQANDFPMSGYELIFMAKRKNAKVFKPSVNWISVQKPVKDRIHPTQKPVELYEVLLERFAFPDYKVVDPFCGSGSSIIASAKLSYPEALGIEKNPETQQKALKRLLGILEEKGGKKR